MRKLSIVGYGRFGELLATLAQKQFDITIVDVDETKTALAAKNGFYVGSLDSLSSADDVAICVPISMFEKVLVSIHPFLNRTQVIFDVCSVKVAPAETMKRVLPGFQTLATHPLFGPDSAKTGIKDSKVSFSRLDASEENVQIWREFWQSLGVIVIDTTPDRHDRDVAYSLAFTHTISKMVMGVDIPNIEFTTKSFLAIKTVAELSSRDTPQLYQDMLTFNPHFKEMWHKLTNSMEVTRKLVDEIITDPASLTEP